MAKKSKEREVIKGNLSDFWETGLEQIAWVVERTIKKSPDEYPYFLKKGDHLIIYDKKRPEKIIWQRKISFFTVIKKLSEVLEFLTVNYEVHQEYPKGIDLSIWKKFVNEKYPVIVISL